MKILPDNCDVLQMYPLSFGECANNFPEVPSEELLKNYLNFGGLPDVVYGSADEKSLRNVLRLIYYETIFKDVAAKYALRDFPLFGSLIKFLAMNLNGMQFGRRISISKRITLGSARRSPQSTNV